ncbi:MAG: hypothetical protein KJZ91_04960, partial [Myxococcales bacterium]|nr:hypothetical protein [Myxococcales bacterium]
AYDARASPGHVGFAQRLPYNVPRRIILLGGRCRAQVRFVASPLLLGHGHSVGGTVVMQAAHSAAAEATRLAAEEDDYDDD